jgi:hypothetical protein
LSAASSRRITVLPPFRLPRVLSFARIGRPSRSQDVLR